MNQLRQFVLLVRKDLILWRRNKLWTFFEIIFPCLLFIPFIVLVHLVYKFIPESNEINPQPVQSFKVHGNQLDFAGHVPALRGCDSNGTSFVFTAKNVEDVQNAKLLMSTFREKFNGPQSNVRVIEKSNETQLSETLRKDYIWEQPFDECSYNRYAGGVVFDRIDLTRRILKYRIWIANRKSDWHVGVNWESPSAEEITWQTFFATGTSKKSNIPIDPPYLKSGILTFQHAIESSFVENVLRRPSTTIVFEGLPELSIKQRGLLIGKVLSFTPIIFALITFVSVIHVCRGIAAENVSVKPFLRSMGLSTPVFYVAHIFSAFLKYLIVLAVVTILLYGRLEYVSLLTVTLTLAIYGLGALTFGALIASIFNNSSSAVKSFLVLWSIMIIVTYFLQPSNEHIFKCFFFGLNINGALSLAIREICNFIGRGASLNFMTMFSGSGGQITFGTSILIMIFDVFWMFILAVFIDDYWKTGGFSLKSLVFKSHKTSGSYEKVRMSDLEDCDELLEGANEIDGARNLAKSGLNIRNLVKVWPTTGERAVDGLSFEAKQGQVSVLLGHNGAGKSTAFQCITGMVKPTQGEVSIGGKDVACCRQNIGLCPQNNPIFDKLTVKEHLWLINGLKGRREDRKFIDEMNKLLEDVKMVDKTQELAMNLSGGMKRKLCVCMALIGQSDVVLLDEPTAGMDPGARKDVQDLLEREKKERTILLTTHYMDEAERLGDWILIMSHGKLVSSGTSKFLKQKYGTGYLLTVVLDVQGEKKKKMAEVLEEVCKFYVMGAQRGERHGQQMEIVLPESEKNEFPQLFKALEAIQNKEFDSEVLLKIEESLKNRLGVLEITSFGLSLNTLEQVFITIGDKVDDVIVGREAREEEDVRLKESFERFIESQKSIADHKGQERQRLFGQISAIFRKKYIYTKRNWASFIGQFLFSLFIIVMVGTLPNLKVLMTHQKEDIMNRFDIDSLTPVRVIWDNDMRVGEEVAKMREILKNQDGFEFEMYSMNDGLINVMRRIRDYLPILAFGFNRDSIWINLKNHHVTPMLISLYNRARLMDDSKIVPIIDSGIHVYMKQMVDERIGAKISPVIRDVIIAPLLVLILALVTSSFVIFLIEERVSRFAHQQLLTGISPITFYGASFLFDLVVFTIIGSIILALCILWNFMANFLVYIILFWLLYFFSCVPFIYAVSSIFKSPSKANVLLVIWQVLISLFAVLIRYGILEMLHNFYQLDRKYISFIEDCFLFFIPSYAFGVSVVYINKYVNDFGVDGIMEWQHLGKSATFMTLFGIFSSVLFIVLKFKTVRKLMSKQFSLRMSKNDQDHDFPPCQAVEQEKQNVENADPQDYSLIVKKLNKKFGKLLAVDNLNLAVDEKECFGLLGVNGAGKTTVFNILTGQTFATSGKAMIGGRDVTEQIAIGYCPQFDALLLDLTGREVLEILGQMHGFSTYRQKAELVLECVGMLPNADKLIRYYSGGQKRKISVGVALLAPTQMIILDEPTAGIDPKARREVWELLIWCRENSNSALMLTSHSMDECEALCSRIAVLNKGKLIAIGTSQELKSLYGNSYTMTLTLNDPLERDNVVNEVAIRLPDSIIRTPTSNKTVNLVWQIPKTPHDNWSEKFEMVQKLAGQLNVKDYILSQSSLEETFLRLSGVNDGNVKKIRKF